MMQSDIVLQTNSYVGKVQYSTWVGHLLALITSQSKVDGVFNRCDHFDMLKCCESENI